MAKNKEKTSNHYANLEPSDSNFLNKVDAKITEFQKQNKKYALDFYYNAKQFVLLCTFFRIIIATITPNRINNVVTKLF